MRELSISNPRRQEDRGASPSEVLDGDFVVPSPSSAEELAVASIELRRAIEETPLIGDRIKVGLTRWLAENFRLSGKDIPLNAAETVWAYLVAGEIIDVASLSFRSLDTQAEMGFVGAVAIYFIFEGLKKAAPHIKQFTKPHVTKIAGHPR